MVTNSHTEPSPSSPPPAHPPRPPDHDRGYLPHWEAWEHPQSITFRLADSLPRALLTRWEEELAGLTQSARDLERRKKIDAALDANHGACHLRLPEIARMVENTLLLFDGSRYQLHAWCIMPTHVHVLVTRFQGETLSRIRHSWKSYTGKEANRRLGRSGQFWQEEYFDRRIRDETHFWVAKRYIEENPVKAGLCHRPED